MPIVSISGSFAGSPASIRIDPSVRKSTVSSGFATANNVPRTVHNCSGIVDCTSSGPVMVPTPRGWFSSSFAFLCKYSPSDVVLGTDWLDACSASLTSVGILDPTPMDIDRLPSGHIWMRRPDTASGVYVLSFIIFIFKGFV
jgi:hypothetical protein